MQFSLFDFLNILWGIGIAITISLSLGPVALITIKRTAEYGLRAGIISSMAIILVDTSATVVILLGLHHVVYLFQFIPKWFYVVGTIALFLYGLRLLFAHPLKTIDQDLPWQEHFFRSFALAVTNPSTYVSFGIIGLFLARFIDRPLFSRVEVAIGFFIGEALWWMAVTYVAFTQRKRYNKAVILNKVIGIVIMALAVLALIHPYVQHPKNLYKTRVFTYHHPQ